MKRTFTGTAPAKAILCGEHAVVYGMPAIAIPISSLQTLAVLETPADASEESLHILAPDLKEEWRYADLPAHHFVRVAIEAVLAFVGASSPPSGTLCLSSSIPLASGMGSSAALAVALCRCVAASFGERLTPAQASQLAWQVEQVQHGTPSGIDNTVIAYAQAIWFQKTLPQNVLTPIQSELDLHLLIANSGIAGSTKEAVGRVRAAWQAEPARFDGLFGEIGAISHAIRAQLQAGSVAEVGKLLDNNHTLLQMIGVSLPKLDTLVAAARQAGALGAKLTGGGLGGNILALVELSTAERVTRALQDAGATQVFSTSLTGALTR